MSPYATLLLLASFSTGASLQAASPAIPKVCSAVDVKAMDVSTAKAGLKDSAAPEVLVPSPAKSEQDVTAGTEDIPVIVLGPALDYTDSLKMLTDLSCTEDGALLRITITHFTEDFGGVIPQNYLWRPRIAMTLHLHRTKATLRTTWVMRSSAGADIKSVQTPPFPRQTYPLVSDKTISR